MSASYVCAACRLRLAVRRNPLLVCHQRQWLTYEPRRSQEPVPPGIPTQKPTRSTRYSRPYLEAAAREDQLQQQVHSGGALETSKAQQSQSPGPKVQQAASGGTSHFPASLEAAARRNRQRQDVGLEEALGPSNGKHNQLPRAEVRQRTLGGTSNSHTYQQRADSQGQEQALQRALRPTDLLAQLDSPDSAQYPHHEQPPRSGRVDHPGSSRSAQPVKPQKLAQQEMSSVAHDLRRKTATFRHHWSRCDKRSLQAMYDIIHSTPDFEVLRSSTHDSLPRFRSNAWTWTLRMAHRWLDVIGGGQPRSTGARSWEYGKPWKSDDKPPGPDLLMNWVGAFTRSHCWIDMLWLLAYSLLEMHARNSGQNNAAMKVGLRQLMSVWNQAMRVRLLERSVVMSEAHAKVHAINPELLTIQSSDWSFLPDIASISKRVSPHHIQSLDAAMSALVPIPRETSNTPDGPIADVNSSLMVTLQLLRVVADDSGVPMGETEAWKPCTALLNAVMETSRLKRAPALLHKIESAPTEDLQCREAYEAVRDAFVWDSATSKPMLQGEREDGVNSKDSRNGAVKDGSAQGRPASTANRAKKEQVGLDFTKWREEATRDAFAGGQSTSTPRTAEEEMFGVDSTEMREEASRDYFVREPSLAETNITKVRKVNFERRKPRKLSELLEHEWALSQIDPDHPTMDRDVLVFQRKLRQATEYQDLAIAERAQEEIRAFYSERRGNRIPLALYGSLMLTFLLLSVPSKAMKLWSELIAVGHSPTSKTYTIIMLGAQHGRDIDGVKHFWDKMRQEGVQPDAHAWSVRTFALFSYGDFDSGMRCLQAMAHEWIATARSALKRERHSGASEIARPSSAELVAHYKGEVDGVARPNQEILNSAISGISGSLKQNFGDDMVGKVLAWGRAFGIEPDAGSYSSLLSIAIRRRRDDEAQRIIQNMQSSGVGTSSTTWEVLLAGYFMRGFFDDLTHQEQEDNILALIHEIDQMASSTRAQGGGGSPGIGNKAYALILDRLLKDYDNKSAAQAVLAHMTGKGLVPNSYICTILMTSYFHSSPPDFDAIEALWNILTSTGRGKGIALDNVFYDRMMEGYAHTHLQLGTTRPLLRILDRMESEGKKASWTTLIAVVHCFAERNEWENIGMLVDRYSYRLGYHVPDSELLRITQPVLMKFLDVVVGTGIYAHEGITSAPQLLRSIQEKEGHSGKARQWDTNDQEQS